MSPRTIELGEAAEGHIGPAARVESDEIEQAKVNELASCLRAHDFYTKVDGEHGPNSAGGTFSLVVADALTTNRFRRHGRVAKEHAKSIYGWLMEHKADEGSRKIIPRVCVDGRLPVQGSAVNQAVVGGHGPVCGAQAELESILRYIAERGEDLRVLAASLGVDIDHADHELITIQARSLLDEGYVSSNDELRNAFVQTAGEASVPDLAGHHAEVVAVINMDKMVTLDRRKIEQVFGGRYESFAVDIGVLPDAAAAVSGSEQEARQKFAALVYYNLATTAVLGDKSLQIVTHIN